ncbi:MmgE/PrpD family protein [Novosphingobium resinovorum]|uniref:MmgE/PrpD family protein n=1 Tax=Novosphingobium resinovorum TaxID=158500 RepID=UPI00361CC9F2
MPERVAPICCVPTSSPWKSPPASPASRPGGFHRHGFHPTSLCGAFGATVGAGLLMGLDAQQIGMAQGIVLSMAGGSLEFLEDGAWTKRLHPGWAASSALTAATMAKHGFVGPKAAYEGRFGLYSLYLRDGAPAGLADACAGLGESWEIENVSVKPLPGLPHDPCRRRCRRRDLRRAWPFG